jgi:flagellar protein FlaG
MNINPISMPTMPSPWRQSRCAGWKTELRGPGALAAPEALQPRASPRPAAGLEKAPKEMNDFVQTKKQFDEFCVDKHGQHRVKVIDTATKDVLRQIPSEEMLAIAKAIDKVKGLLVHQKA